MKGLISANSTREKMLKNILCVVLVGVLCLGQAKGKGGVYYSMAQKAYQNKDYQKALEYYKKAASMGNVRAYFNLGIMYGNGEGVAQDTDKAIKYFEKACDLGDVDGCEAIK